MLGLRGDKTRQYTGALTWQHLHNGAKHIL